METKGFFLIWNHHISVSSFRFIWIHILWVSGHLKYLILILSVSLESDISRRQILKYKDGTRAEKVNIGRVMEH